MKLGAYLYNVSRSGIVDEATLQERLRDGALVGAALDVFADEPLPSTSSWWDEPNVIITPHLGAAWGSMWDAALELFATTWRAMSSAIHFAMLQTSSADIERVGQLGPRAR